MISQLLTKKFLDLMQIFIKDLFSDCGYPREAGSLPVDVRLKEAAPPGHAGLRPTHALSFALQLGLCVSVRGARVRVQRARVHRLRLPRNGVQVRPESRPG